MLLNFDIWLIPFIMINLVRIYALYACMFLSTWCTYKVASDDPSFIRPSFVDL